MIPFNCEVYLALEEVVGEVQLEEAWHLHHTCLSIRDKTRIDAWTS